MPSSSPYQNNDYAAVSSFRPMKLPINDIFKSITAQDRIWDVGAERVMSAHNAALNLSLVTDDNRGIRDQYIKDAQKQLTKLSSMNLGDPSIQRKGIGIYDNLMKDQDIIGEDYVVNNLNKEFQNGMSFRTKEGGKYYNPLSIENIQFEKSLLSKDLNKRDGWKSLYQNMSTYSPQVDTAVEYKKITDLLKAEDIKNAQIKGDEWYIEEVSKKGVSKERILAAIENMGSPQLKQQMRVEGRNTFYKHLASNPAAVDGYFQSLANNLFDNKIADLSNNKAELEYQMYLIPNDGNATNSAKRSSYQRVIDNLKTSIRDLSNIEKPKYVSEFTNLTDMTNLSSSLSKIEQLWQSATFHELAPKLAWESSSQEIKPNNAKIAKENINVAIQRLNLGYANLGEDVRHNKATEADNAVGRQLELLRIQTQAKKGIGSGTEPIFGDGTSTGTTIATPEVSNPNESDKAKIAETQKTTILTELDNMDNNVRKSVISSVIGENALISIESKIGETGTISQTKALEEPDIDKAAAFMKAFYDKNGRTQGVISGRSMIKGLAGRSVDEWKNSIRNMSPSAFKKAMGEMATKDLDFSADLITKIATDNGDPNGQLKAEQLRATINSNTRLQQNVSKQIFTEQEKVLGNLSKYFDNNGRVPLDQNNINKAYGRYLADQGQPKFVIEEYSGVNPKTGVPLGRPTIKAVTDEELKKYKSGELKLATTQKLVNKVPTVVEFGKKVTEVTNPIFYGLAVNNNVQSASHIFGDKDDAFSFAEKLPNVIQYADSDDKNKIEKVLEFIGSRSDKLAGYNIRSKKKDEPLPTVQLRMQGLSKEDQAAWEYLQDVRIPVITANKEWMESDHTVGKFKSRGDFLAITPTKDGQISIMNMSNDAGTISAEVIADNVYVIENGKKLLKTGSEIKAMIERKLGTREAPTLDQIITLYPETVNNLLARIANNIDIANKEAKDK